MTHRLSKFVLTTHITTSVGWLGAVAAFLVLSINGLTSHNAEVVRGAYHSMNLIGLCLRFDANHADGRGTPAALSYGWK